MPHDAVGNLLQAGDEVILRGVVIEVQPSDEYCNITIESVFGRKPDGMKERVSAINAAVLEKVPSQPPTEGESHE